LLQFEGEGEVINDLEVEFRRDEKVMRFLTVKLDIHAKAWAEKRRKKINPKLNLKRDVKN
jgi:small subunit ribosomal protein S6